MAETKKPEPYGNKGLDVALERFRVAADAEDTRRQRQLADYKFSIGRYGPSPSDTYQWDDNDKAHRVGRPILTHNRIGPHIRQVLNQIRQAKQSIKVIPVDNGADPDKAEVRQGVFRCIESKSKALTAYVMAADQQMRMGEAFVRVLTEYENGYKGKQRLVVRGIRNRFSVYADPASQEYDGSDWRYLFIVEELEKEEYRDRYGESEAAHREHFSGVGQPAAEWFKDGGVRVAEYFRVETTWKNGEATGRKVFWRKMNGIEWLSKERELPIPWIPVARAVGEMTDVEGDVDYRGLVPDAVDAQKSLNYEESQMAEALGIGNRIPYIGYAASFVGLKEWDDANSHNYAYLRANAVDSENKQLGLLPLPQRNPASPDIQALAFAGQRAENNLRNALGVIDVDSAERTQEQSGKAIRERKMQSDLSNSHFAENLALMIQQVGRILDAWLPHVYDAPRVMEIVGADEQRRRVMVYSGEQMQPPQGAQLPQGLNPEKDIYDLSIGAYDVEIDIGPSYPTRRKEAVDMMTQVITADPSLLKVMGDLYFGNMDWPEARAIGKRFKKMLPPELQDKEGQPEVPPEVQQQMQQAQQQMQLMAKELEEKTRYIETEQAKQQADVQREQAKIQSTETIKLAELESEEKIAFAKLDQEWRIAVLKAQTEANKAALAAQQGAQDREAARQDGHMDRVHEAREGEAERSQMRELHDVDLHVEMTEAQASREHERMMQREQPKAGVRET